MEPTTLMPHVGELIPFLKNVFVGVIGLLLTLLINAGFLRRIAINYEIHARVWLNRGNPNGVFVHYFLALIYLMLVQILLIVFWGMSLTWLSLVNDPLAAVNFAGSCFTTIGLVNDIMPPGWRFMSNIIALSGLFTVAMATASMLNMTTLFRRAWLMKHADKIQEVVDREKIVIPDFVSFKESISVKTEITTKDHL